MLGNNGICDGKVFKLLHESQTHYMPVPNLDLHTLTLCSPDGGGMGLYFNCSLSKRSPHEGKGINCRTHSSIDSKDLLPCILIDPLDRCVLKLVVVNCI